jgi:hypothetical protein
MIEQNAEEENAERNGCERAKRRRQVDAANGGAGLSDAFEERFFGASSVGVVEFGRSGSGRGHSEDSLKGNENGNKGDKRESARTERRTRRLERFYRTDGDSARGFPLI